MIAYWSLTEGAAWQATLGKRWLGLRVTAHSGKRLTWRQALLRATIKFLPFESGHIAMMLPAPKWQQSQNGLRPAHIVMFVLLALYLLVFAATNGQRSIPDLLHARLLPIVTHNRAGCSNIGPHGTLPNRSDA